MTQLHNELMRTSGWYRAWHEHRGHVIAHWFLFLFVAALVVSSVLAGVQQNYGTSNLYNSATVLNAFPMNQKSRPIAGHYIIEFKPEEKDPAGLAKQIAQQYEGTIQYTYTKAIKGFAGSFPDVAIKGLKNNPHIKIVEQDQTVQAVGSEYQPPWGIDRVDQLNTPIDRYYNYNYTGAGVNAYVIDTGIRSTHTEFTGRIGNGVTEIVDGYGIDGCHWHGTHVAGTIGGTTYGIAKAVTLHSVRVLDCNGSGSTSGVIAGIDWVVNNKTLPAVANMSISGGFSQALNDATKNLVNAGVTVVVAAGNSASDACGYSPSSEPTAITVGATSLGSSPSLDYQSSFSNWGTCVDLYAPGNGILSAMNTSDTASGFANGTSMASPHVAGVAALYLQENPSATPSQVATQITSKGSGGVLTGLGTGSPNLLLNSLFTGSGAALPPPDTLAPSTPTNVSASVLDPTDVSVTWIASTDNVGVTGYKVFRDGSLLATQTSGSAAWTDTTVTGGNTYSYTVSAFDAAGNNSGLSNTASVTVPTAPVGPVSISSYSVTNITATTATINWITNVATIGNVTYRPSRISQSQVTPNTSLSTSHSQILSSLAKNTSYSFTISTVGITPNVIQSGSFKTRPK